MFGGRFGWSPERRLTFAGGQVTLAHWRVHLDACPRLADLGSLRLAACLSALLGRLEGAGRGFSPDRSVVRPYYAASLGLWGGGELTPGWRWSLRAAALVPLHRERFLVDGQGVAYTLPALGGELAAAVARVF